MQAQAPSQLPNSLDGIQFGTVGRQVVQSEVSGVVFSPLLMQAGVMVFGVVCDHYHAASGSNTRTPEAFQKREEGLSVEHFRLTAILKSPVPQPHCAEVSDAYVAEEIVNGWPATRKRST
jgi:hypothetical protein